MATFQPDYRSRAAADSRRSRSAQRGRLPRVGFSVRIVESLKSLNRHDVLLISGLLLMPFQVVQIAGLQFVHIWMLVALALVFLWGDVKIGLLEVIVYIVFIAATCALTLLQDEPRIKAGEQMLKFGLVYPGFYILGRSIGFQFRNRQLPFGYIFLVALLIFEFAVERLQIPIIFKENNFAFGALHGTFKERNWLSSYFFLVTYWLVLSERSERRFVPFFLMNGLIMVLTLGKTVMVACGAIFILNSRVHVALKVAVMIVGGLVYYAVVGNQFSANEISVRIEEERGLAYQLSADLIEKNPVGYGFGFVEGYFAESSVEVRGLGAGTNSVFAAPLDMALIAGPFGVALWLVIFCGLGLGIGPIIVLMPIALLSLLNPLHQSEMYYLFIGIYAAQAMRRPVARRIVAASKNFGRVSSKQTLSPPKISADS